MTAYVMTSGILCLICALGKTVNVIAHPNGITAADAVINYALFIWAMFALYY